MIVSAPRLSFHGSRARVSALIRSETRAFDPFEMVLGVPRPFAGFLDLSGNPFVPTLTLSACVLGERLRVEAPVSARLLQGAARAARLYQSWWGYRATTIEAEPDPCSGPAGPGAGLFFTRGVDSWFSALRGQAGELPERLTHLLYVADLDRHYSPGNRSRALELTAEAADRLGLPLVPVSHNGRLLIDRILRWDDTHGGVLAGIGLLLGGVLSRVVIASTHDQDGLRPHGSHPDLDPLWSTERTTFRVDGLETTRTNKTRTLARHPLALARLKVCWEQDIEGNCGRCRKCLRTMIALELAGVLEQTPSFDQPLTAAAFVALPPATGQTRRTLLDELYESFPPDHPRADLRAAIARRLAARARRRRCARHVIPPLPFPVAVEVSPGCAAELVPEIVRQRLPGPLVVRQGGPDKSPVTPCLEITWTAPAAGRVALPWRPAVADALDILDLCQEQGERPLPWCVLDLSTPRSVELSHRLTADWGPGLCCLQERSTPDSDAGTPLAEAAAIQRCCAIRAWVGPADHLDPFRVLEAVRHGCLPLQFVPAGDHGTLVECLPPGLAAFTLPLPPSGRMPRLNAAEQADRLDRGLSVLLAGTLERDLTHALERLRDLTSRPRDRVTKRMAP